MARNGLIESSIGASESTVRRLSNSDDLAYLNRAHDHQSGGHTVNFPCGKKPANSGLDSFGDTGVLNPPECVPLLEGESGLEGAVDCCTLSLISSSMLVVFANERAVLQYMHPIQYWKFASYSSFKPSRGAARPSSLTHQLSHGRSYRDLRSKAVRPMLLLARETLHVTTSAGICIRYRWLDQL